MTCFNWQCLKSLYYLRIRNPYVWFSSLFLAEDSKNLGNFLSGNGEVVLTFTTYHLEPHLWSYLPPTTLMGLFILVTHTFWNIFCVLPYILSFIFACCISLLLECKLFKGRHLCFIHRCITNIQNTASTEQALQYILTEWIHEWMSEIIWSKLIWKSLIH